MGLDVILAAVLPAVLKGIAAAVEQYEQGKVDSATLKTKVDQALDDGKAKVAALLADFSQEHIDAFKAMLKAAAPK